MKRMHRTIYCQILCFILFFSTTLAFTQAVPLWSGSITCQLDDEEQGVYQRQEIQTWTLTGAPPENPTTIPIYQATWQAQAQGQLLRTQAAQTSSIQWVANVPGPGGQAPTVPIVIRFRNSDQKMIIGQWRAPMTVPNAVNGQRQIFINGVPQGQPAPFSRGLAEWTFPRIEASSTDSTISGSSQGQVDPGSAELVHHYGGLPPTATCKWNFTKGGSNGGAAAGGGGAAAGGGPSSSGAANGGAAGAAGGAGASGSSSASGGAAAGGGASSGGAANGGAAGAAGSAGASGSSSASGGAAAGGGASSGGATTGGAAGAAGASGNSSASGGAAAGGGSNSMGAASGSAGAAGNAGATSTNGAAGGGSNGGAASSGSSGSGSTSGLKVGTPIRQTPSLALLTGISPATNNGQANITVTLTGQQTHFATGASTVSFTRSAQASTSTLPTNSAALTALQAGNTKPSAVQAGKTQASTAGSLSVPLTMNPASAAGTYNIVVTTPTSNGPETVTLNNAFTVTTTPTLNTIPVPAGNTNTGNKTAASASAKYRAVITGLLCMQHVSSNDAIYAAAVVRQYDRRNNQNMMSTNMNTWVYGDVNGLQGQRKQAGSRGPGGGIGDGDLVPTGFTAGARDTQPTPQVNNLLPLTLWEGTLTDGVDALVISPSLWINYGDKPLFNTWNQNEDSFTNSIFTDSRVQNQIKNQTLGTIVVGSSQTVGGSTVQSVAGDVVQAVADTVLVIPFVELQGNPSHDRPVGVGDANPSDPTSSMILPNTTLVLTREMIEKYVGAKGWTMLSIDLKDTTQGFTTLAGSDRRGEYMMFVQIERTSVTTTTPPPASGAGANGSTSSNSSGTSIDASASPNVMTTGPLNVTTTTLPSSGIQSIAQGPAISRQPIATTPLTAAQLPQITSVSPNTGAQGTGNISVVIIGNSSTQFTRSTKVDFGAGITVAFQGASGNKVDVTLTIASGAALVGHTVTLTTGTQTVKLDNAFTVTALQTSGNYRIYIDRFDVGHQTNDDTNTDGQGNEVYLAVHTHTADRLICGINQPNVANSAVFGDVGGHPERTRAGSASATGGLLTGDSVQLIPTLTLWQGNLSNGGDIVVLNPTLWDWNGNPGLYTQWVNYTQQYTVILQNSCTAEVAATGIHILQPSKPYLGYNGSGDRPLGLKNPGPQCENVNCAAKYFYSDRILILTREKLEWLLNSSQSAGLTPGTFPITFTDEGGPPGYPSPGGSYTVYLHVQRIQ